MDDMQNIMVDVMTDMQNNIDEETAAAIMTGDEDALQKLMQDAVKQYMGKIGGTVSYTHLDVYKRQDQENIVRSFANPKRDAKPAAPEHRTEASKTEASRTEAPRTEAPKTEAPKAEAARNQDGGSKGEPAKKKLTAVFRPQNAQQQIKRPVPPKPQGGKQGHTAPALAAACLLYTSRCV